MRARHIVTSLVLIAYTTAFATPAFADRVETRHVTQVFTGAQKVPDLRLRDFQNDNVPHTEFLFPLTPANEISQPYFETIGGMDLSILLQPQDPPKAPPSDVEVAICDCGELFVPVAGGFPKWPFVFLAGVPFLFLKRGQDELPPIVLPTPTNTPTTQQTPVPEPTSLLLLLTGVCAVGLRLRKSTPASNRDGKTDDV